MKVDQLIMVSCLLLTLAACNNDNEAVKRVTARDTIAMRKTTDTTPKADVQYLDIDSALHARLVWVDSAADGYMSHTKNQLIRLAIKDGYTENWLWDQLAVTDTAAYVVLHIGHEFESNFVTDGWLYMDTSTRKVYEYNTAENKLQF